jgi:hypothetical protein
MEMQTHTLNMLFAQLGLPDSAEDIERFIARHSLRPDEKIAEAPFWSPEQSRLLREMWNADSDWCEIVDELNTRLHK